MLKAHEARGGIWINLWIVSITSHHLWTYSQNNIMAGRSTYLPTIIVSNILYHSQVNSA